MRTLVGAVVLVGMLALSGCVDGDPIPTLPPTPTATPLFASEEEALAAAEEAYAAYGEMSALIASEGGINPDRIAPLVTEARSGDELRGFQTLRDSALKIVGASEFSVMGLQRFDQIGDDVEVAFYACVDLSGSRVIDASGRDVTPGDRVDRVVLEVVMVTEHGRLPLLLESDNEWSSQSC